MSKEDKVLEYLARKNLWYSMPGTKYKYGRRGITVREAMEVLGTTELRKIMSRLRQRGLKVWDVWEVGRNKFGEETKYKRYFVEPKCDQHRSLVESLAGQCS